MVIIESPRYLPLMELNKWLETYNGVEICKWQFEESMCIGWNQMGPTNMRKLGIPALLKAEVLDEQQLNVCVQLRVVSWKQSKHFYMEWSQSAVDIYSCRVEKAGKRKNGETPNELTKTEKEKKGENSFPPSILPNIT